MRLRPALPEDASAIARTEEVAAHHPWTREQVAASLALPTTRGWVAEAGVVRAHLLVSSQGAEGEVLILAVHPSCRRRGWARQLLRAACEAWTELGVEEAFLEIRADNQAALRLYAELGWETAGTRTSYYHDGTDAVVMRWQAIPGGR
ncbi:MAG: ribosomal protein S18-alanine N-acetyltransferase [Deltaproteobacteria bacterium]|nr:ribosomal protein S18-alanine N-acetyltransferase [Deltaproteobacteria bacterium]